ncbi:hypothetical protein HMSSN036_33330 [Paenibacillus macerans]|nr:hypothetical protein HMSSN036_33330 [Paenibacillus macerans]
MGTGKMEANPFVIADAGKCIGCKACELACFAVHNRENGVSAAVGTITIPVIPRLYVTRRALRGAGAVPALRKRALRGGLPGRGDPPGKRRHSDRRGALHRLQGLCAGLSVWRDRAGQIVFARPGSAAERTSAHTERGAEPKPRLVASKCDLCQSCAPLHTWAEVAGQTQGGAMEAGAAESRPAGRTLEPGPADAAASPACVAACPVGALSLVTGKPERTVRPFPDLKAMPF